MDKPDLQSPQDDNNATEGKAPDATPEQPRADAFGNAASTGGGAAPTMLETNHDPELTMIVSGVAKAYAMTGFRVGWLVAAPELIELAKEKLDFEEPKAEKSGLPNPFEFVLCLIHI